MKEFVINYLDVKGYNVNNHAITVIQACDDWYSNRLIKDFHKRTNLNGIEYELQRVGFAKRCCEDDANLCEVLSVAPEEENSTKEFIDELFKNSNFEEMFREQLEKIAAVGTAGAYINITNADSYEKADGSTIISGGELSIVYVDADCIIPLTVVNKIVTECAFSVTNTIKGKEKTTLVIFSLSNNRYLAETVVFDESGSEINEEYNSLQLGEKKPFSILRTASVNNLDNMKGYGFPKLYNSIPELMAVDLCYSLLFGDLSKGDKVVFINELLACITRNNETGMPMLTPKQQEIFVLLGEKLPEQNSIVHEYNPQIRVDEITKAFELTLSLLSMKFGYGSKKYTFENGQIKTATEYIGDKQDEMQELNKQRSLAENYITELINAAIWFSNEFKGTNYEEQPLLVEFDDSYIEDRVSKLESLRTDAVQFGDIPILKVWYLMEKFNISQEEAEKYVQGESLELDMED